MDGEGSGASCDPPPRVPRDWQLLIRYHPPGWHLEFNPRWCLPMGLLTQLLAIRRAVPCPMAQRLPRITRVGTRALLCIKCSNEFMEKSVAKANRRIVGEDSHGKA